MNIFSVARKLINIDIVNNCGSDVVFIIEFGIVVIIYAGRI